MICRAACNALHLALIVMALATLAACQLASPEGPPVLTSLAAPSRLQSAEPRVNSAIPGNRNLQNSFGWSSTT
jgi:hypothetical protein